MLEGSFYSMINLGLFLLLLLLLFFVFFSFCECLGGVGDMYKVVRVVAMTLKALYQKLTKRGSGSAIPATGCWMRG